jgi:hypothetical protein
MKIAAWLLALFTIAVGIMGIFATDSAMTLRRLYFATPGRFYAAGAVRLTMGFVLILAASSSRWPRIVRVLGVLMCLQAIAANLFGLERARSIMEWEVMQGVALLRAGAAVALASGIFLGYAFRPRRAANPGCAPPFEPALPLYPKPPDSPSPKLLRCKAADQSRNSPLVAETESGQNVGG